ncbi:winged helix-turn-helix domain-containing protein [Streptomyces sp. NPDC058469]
MIGRQFRLTCCIAGVRLLHRHGWSWQSPALAGPGT